jgi:hypothetical protein
MPVTPLPGADCKDLLESLRYVYTGAVNARSSGGGEPHLHYNAYIGWAFEAVRMLRGKVAPADLEQLVLTRSFWALQASGTSTPANRARLVDVELDERVSALEATCKDLEAQIDRWSRDGTFVVADTSFYIQHPQGIDDLDRVSICTSVRKRFIYWSQSWSWMNLTVSSRPKTGMFEVGPAVHSQSSIVPCPTRPGGVCCARRISRLFAMEESLAVR